MGSAKPLSRGSPRLIVGFYPSIRFGARSHGLPFWVGSPQTDRGYPSLIGGSPDVAIVGNIDFLPSRGTSGHLAGAPSHQLILGGCPSVGNTLPAAPHIAGSQHLQGSLPHESTCIYIVDRRSPCPGINDRRKKSAKKINKKH
jgi:hypothetical protein